VHVRGLLFLNRKGSWKKVVSDLQLGRVDAPDNHLDAHFLSDASPFIIC
jgi:hypothetical protein